MRLFLAVRLDDQAKESVYNNIKKLSGGAESGHFTEKQNLFITLLTLGEVERERTPDIKEIMDRIIERPFELAMGGLGKFRKPTGGVTYFQGVDKHPTLISIRRQLNTSFKAADFKTEAGDFKPTVILGHECIMKPNFDEAGFSADIPVITMEVKKISLMRSEYLGDHTVYSELYAHPIYEA